MFSTLLYSLITPFKFTWNSIAPFTTQTVLGGLKTSPYYVKTVDPPTTLSYWTLQFNGNSLKHFWKWMTELLFTNFTTENAKCSVHITVLIMAEQIVHDTMVGDAEIPCQLYFTGKIYINYINEMTCFWLTCAAPFHVIFTNTCCLILRRPRYPNELWK